MSYLPMETPAPEPAMDDLAFWSHCREKRLCFQKCEDCGRHRHPPTPLCPHCQSSRIGWSQATSRGVIFSYTIIHYAAHDSVRSRLPYNVVVVEFPDLEGTRLISNVVNAEPGALRIGLPVDLVWEEADEGWWLPRFRLADEGN